MGFFFNSSCQLFPKGPHFGITLRHPFLAEEKFSKGAFGANINNFEAGARVETTHFFVQILQKVPKNAVL